LLRNELSDLLWRRDGLQRHLLRRRSRLLRQQLPEPHDHYELWRVREGLLGSCRRDRRLQRYDRLRRDVPGHHPYVSLRDARPVSRQCRCDPLWGDVHELLDALSRRNWRLRRRSVPDRCVFPALRERERHLHEGLLSARQ
jgi:hypothetical protein